MWKRDEAVKPINGNPAVPMTPTQPAAAAPPMTASPARPSAAILPVGRSVVIKGELSGSEDLTIEGAVEGTIDLHGNVLTIGASASVKAQVQAKTVIVLGSVRGDISASEKVEIRDGASVEGDVVSPRLSIADGAHFGGSVDMRPVPRDQRASQQRQRVKPTEMEGTAALASAAAH